MAVETIKKGGGFLIEDTSPQEVFTPEDFSEEQRMFAKTAEDFLMNEVIANMDRTEVQEEGVMAGLLKKAGELGLLMIDIPEKYDGLGLDKVTSAIVSEVLSKGGAFASSFGGQVGIGTLPIVYFGTEEQKEKYLSRLATGELISAYALTEPGSGSDALAARSKAELSADGKHWILNGDKVFITNGGFADVFIVFAKVDGEKFSCFIVEKDMGIQPGAEEHKMGIKGSSTTQLFMENLEIPKENLLGEIGKGHKIAFNILNVGRFKLGVGSLGGSKIAFDEAVKYSNERKQFGVPISSFGMMKSKIANMATQIYALDAMCYRTAGLLDDILEPIAGDDPDFAEKTMAGIEEYVTECSILKIKGSEVLDYCVDEAVQIHGGYGYIAEYPVERYYRDARVARIYEGTNEINRMLTPGMLLKRAIKGDLPLLQAAKQLQEELLDIPSFDEDEADGPLTEEKKLIDNAKKVSVLMLGLAGQKFGEKLQDEQGVLGNIADIMIEAFGMESTYLRTMKMVEARGEAESQTCIDMTRLYCQEAMGKIDLWARELLAASSEGDELRTMLVAMRRLVKYTPIDTLHLRNGIADTFIEKDKYEI